MKEMMGDLFGGREARDEGMAKVAQRDPDWMDTGLSRIALLPLGWEGIGEDIMRECNLYPAPHPNAIGSLINTAVRRGLLVSTGKLGMPKRKSRHASRTQIWKRATAA